MAFDEISDCDIELRILNGACGGGSLPGGNHFHSFISALILVTRCANYGEVFSAGKSFH